MSKFLDHVIYVCADLERGSQQFEALTGVRPSYGGVHANGTTQNAIVGLGGRCYLEILAPVKGAHPDDDQWTNLARAAETPRMLTYCMRAAMPLPELARCAAAHGWLNAKVESNGRKRPDGIQLRWQWLAPVVGQYGFAFPFFIDWLDSPHPSEMARPRGKSEKVSLTRFAIGHPQAAALKQMLGELGYSVNTYQAHLSSFRVELDTPRGPILL